MPDAGQRHRISVVIPCHNYGRYLPEAVASVSAQTRPPDEVVIIDDGSTDDTPAVIAEISKAMPAVRSLSRSPARGPAQTFNDGIRASEGDLVMLLSADDRMSPAYLERMEEAFADPAVGFAYTEAHLFGAAEGVEAAPEFNERELMVENPYNGSGVFRRSLFDAAGGFRTDFDRLGLEDWEFWVHLVALGARGKRVHGCWLEYRRHETGSRNTMPRGRVLRAHLRVWSLHHPPMRMRDLARWAARSITRNAVRLARRP